MALLSRGEGHTKKVVTNVGAAAGVTATLAASTGKRTVVTHISGSSDAACLITIESPAATILWQKRLAAAGTFSENFSFGEIEATDGSDILVKVSASTTHSEANIAGLQVGL